MQTKVGRVSVRGIELEFEEAGAGDRAFVLVHGFTGSRDDWREHLPDLAELGRTIAIDQRGHGGSTNPERADGYSLETLVADLEAALEALEVTRCDLLGHSMGGMVALRHALAHADRIASLVLMDTSASPMVAIPESMRVGALALIRASGMTGLADAMRKSFEHSNVSMPAAVACAERMGPDVYHGRIRTKLGQMDPVAFEVLGAELADHESVEGRLEEIRCPSLVIVGEQDHSFRKPSESLQREIVDAQLVVVAGAGHSPQLESPDAWRRAIVEHLERVRG